MTTENELVVEIQRLQVHAKILAGRLELAHKALQEHHAPCGPGDRIRITSEIAKSSGLEPAPGVYTIIDVTPTVPYDWSYPLFWTVKMRGKKRKITCEMYRYNNSWNFGPLYTWTILENNTIPEPLMETTR